MDTARRRWLIGWGVAVVLLGAWLLLADKPWGEIADDIEAREAIGKSIKVRHYSTIALWWTGLGSWIVLALSIIGIRWWTAPLSAVKKGIVCRGKTPRLAWAGLLVIVAVGAGLRIPLATKSLAVDELWNAKLTIVGYYFGESDDALEDRYFGAASFERAMWLYSRPNNHPVAAVAARASHVLLSDLVDPDRLPHEFRDFIVRLPTFLVSLICIGLVGILAFRFISPVAGLTAAFLLAIQPWHIKFGVEVRAYSWVLLWTLLGVWCLTKIFEKGKPAKWRYWFWFGINQALIVWSFPYAAFLASGFFFGGIALAFQSWPDRDNRIIALRRLVFVNVMAALIFIHAFGPNLLQTREWLETVNANHQNHGLDGFWFSKTILQFTTGFASGNPVVEWIFPAIALASAGWGGFVLWRNQTSRPFFLALGSVVLGTLFALAYFKIANPFFYPRYVSFGLLPMIFLMAAGGASFKINPVLPVLGCLLTISVVEPRLQILRNEPLEPLRDVSEFLISQHQGEIIPVGYGHSTEYLPVYLPTVRKPLENREELEAVIAEARSSERPLFVVIGRPEYNRVATPSGFELLDDPKLFSERVAFGSVEQSATYRILELKNDPTVLDR